MQESQEICHSEKHGQRVLHLLSWAERKKGEESGFAQRYVDRRLAPLQQQANIFTAECSRLSTMTL